MAIFLRTAMKLAQKGHREREKKNHLRSRDATTENLSISFCPKKVVIFFSHLYHRRVMHIMGMVKLQTAHTDCIRQKSHGGTEKNSLFSY